MAFLVEMDVGFLRLKLHGTVSSADLFGMLGALNRLERELPQVPHRLIDLTEIMSSEVKAEEIREIAARRQASHYKNGFRSAIAAVKPAQLGYARMFQILNEHPEIEIQIFPTPDEAVVWLRAAKAQAAV